MADSVLVIGGGAREHCLAWKLAQSDGVGQVFVSPGNAGTAFSGKIRNVSVDFTNHSALAQWCRDYNIKMVIVGPEDPLANGLADDLKVEGILCFGPSKNAAVIESNKVFAKSFMERHNIPTARWKAFTDFESAKQHILSAPYPALVIKASGLAAGKGVIVAESKQEAVAAVQSILQEKIFGSAGDVVVVEELLCGEEVSVLCFTDGEIVVMMPPAQDHKRLMDGDKGPNTGGMGAYAPCPLVSARELEQIKSRILQGTVAGLKKEGRAFVGVLFAGIMLTKNGPKVLEFNCRFGDPETQAILPLLDCDLYPIMLACLTGDLKKATVRWKEEMHAVGLVLASKGYPGSYSKGMKISGINEVLDKPRYLVFHSGTAQKDEEIVTNGGRVMVVVYLGNDLITAIRQAQGAAELIQFEGKQYRKDIGHKAISKLLGTGFGLTYQDAGVNIVAGDTLVHAIQPLAAKTLRKGVIGSIGGFGGMFDLAAAGFKDPILVSGTDGVGTKLKIAEAVGTHNTIGIDLVAMCVNDVLAHGAEPLFFLDYYACGKLQTDVATEVIYGVAKGCRLAGCALIGGETAEMPGMYGPNVYDLAGFAVGAVEREKELPRVNSISNDDVIIGIASTGAHSNGFSLIRKIVERHRLSYSAPAPFNPSKSLGIELLTPTKIYSKTLLPVIQSGMIKAYAHITGGGLIENIPRVLPSSLAAHLDANTWPIPPVFGWISVAGSVPTSEMLRTFNCGLGAILIVGANDAEQVIQDVQKMGEMAWKIGSILPLQDGDSQVIVSNFQQAINSASSMLNIAFPTLPSPTPSLKKKVAVLISGTGTNLQALINHSMNPINDSAAEIVLVVSNVPGAQGLTRAESVGIPTKIISHKNYDGRLQFDMAVHQLLTEAGIDIVCLAGFMRILTGEFVRLWNGRMLNVHPSLLPSFKGTNAQKQALEAGVRITGCSVHFVTEEVDGGAVLVQETVPVEIDDTVESLSERILQVEHIAFPKALELVAREKAALGPNGKICWKL